MSRIFVFLLFVVVLYAQSPANYYPAMTLLDQLWGLNYTQMYGPPELACNCSYANPAAFSPCRWIDAIKPSIGFYCVNDSQGGRLNSIVFVNGSFLTPILPTEIGVFDSLRYLIVTDSSLKGELPGTIGSLVNLEHLSVTGNFLSGSVPASLNTMSRLYHIDLEYNQFKGNLPSLDSISGIPSLTFLFGNNKFTGSIPSNWGNFDNLINLEIDYNKLSGNLNVFADTNMTSLKTLRLGSNSFGGVFPSNIITSSLVILDISRNQFTDPLPDLSVPSFLMGNCRLEYNQFSSCQTQPRPECSTACSRICVFPPPVSGAVCDPATGQWLVTDFNITTGTTVISGNLTIVGNVTLVPQTILVIGPSGVINVTDTIVLDGTLSISVGDIDGDVERTVITAGTIVGNFTSVTTDQKCVRSHPVQTSKTLTILLSRDDTCNKKTQMLRIILGVSIGVGLLLIITLGIGLYLINNVRFREWLRGN